MAEELTCSSCKKRITNEQGGVAVFPCPKCIEHKIVRCKHCRETAAKYSCSCGFTGPN